VAEAEQAGSIEAGPPECVAWVGAPDVRAERASPTVGVEVEIAEVVALPGAACGRSCRSPTDLVLDAGSPAGGILDLVKIR
jgi:hypothetical protein